MSNLQFDNVVVQIEFNLPDLDDFLIRGEGHDFDQLSHYLCYWRSALVSGTFAKNCRYYYREYYVDFSVYGIVRFCVSYQWLAKYFVLFFVNISVTKKRVQPLCV